MPQRIELVNDEVASGPEIASVGETAMSVFSAMVDSSTVRELSPKRRATEYDVAALPVIVELFTVASEISAHNAPPIVPSLLASNE